MRQDLNRCSLLEDPKRDEGLLVEADTDSKYRNLKKNLFRIVHRRVPTVMVRKEKSPPWIDAEVVDASNKKAKAFKKAKVTNSQYWWDTFKERCNAIKNLVKRKYTDYICHLSDNLGNNPKRFWGFVRSLKKSKGNLVDLKDNGIEYNTPDSKAELLNFYLSESFYGKTGYNSRLCVSQTG